MAAIDPLHNILAIELGGLGDLLLATPSLRAIKARYPEGRLTVLSIPRSAEIIEGLPYVDEIRVLNLDDAKPLRWLRSPAALARLLSALLDLRRQRYDATVNLRTINSWSGAVKMAVIFWFCGSPLKAGRSTEGRGFFLNRSAPEKDFDTVPEAEFAARVARLLDVEVNDLTPDLTLSEQEHAAAEALLRREGLGDRPILAVNPGAAWPSKQWPVDRFAQVVDALRDEFDCDVIATGSAGESPLADDLERISQGQVVSLAGKTTLKELAAVLERVQLFITNDTGPMHIAATLGVRMVAVFGPGEYDRYYPVGPQERMAVLRSSAPCAPCPRYSCPSMECLYAISADEVLQAAQRLWRQS